MNSRIVGGTGISVSQEGGFFPYINTNHPFSGSLRIHNGAMEIFDGLNWVITSQTTTRISVDPVLDHIMIWAKEKMDEEYKLRDLAKKNNFVATALETFKKAEEQLRIIAILAEEQR